jgi:hypothetical protein
MQVRDLQHSPWSRQTSPMITKTFFIGKTFRAHSTNYLRQEKGFHDLWDAEAASCCYLAAGPWLAQVSSSVTKAAALGAQARWARA